MPEWNTYLFNTDLFGSYTLSLFSVVNQFAFISILGEINNPTLKGMKKVVGSSSALPLAIYYVLGIFGYMTYGNKTEDIVINREKISNTDDIYMTIARSSLCIVLITGIIIRTNANEANTLT